MDESPEGGEPPAKKRLADAEEDAEDNEEDQDWDESMEEPKVARRGRPQSTGLCVERAKAVETYNRKLKERARLEEEKVIRGLTINEVFEKLETDLDRALDEMKNAPTADVASRVRKCMGEVARVARTSSNLKGTYKKVLKHSAVLGAAAMDVLRTRLDRMESGSETRKQLNEIRWELNTVKSEAKANEEKARKEIAELREELAAASEGMKRARERRRRVLRDGDSPPRWPVREEAGEVAEGNNVSGLVMSPEDNREVEDESTREENNQTPEYNDERRKREIMPPPSEIPPAIRPSIRGKVKILDDVSLGRHKVRLADSRSREGPETRGETEEGSGGRPRTLWPKSPPC